MNPLFAAWLFALMCWISPIEKGVDAGKLDDSTAETVEARAGRYRQIAEAVTELVHREGQRLPFSGRTAKHRTAVLLLAISYTESGWRKDVDTGIGPRARGDGKDSCVAQIRVGAGRTAEGWTHADLTGDHGKCFAASLRLVNASMAACKHLPHPQRLAAYAAGRCESEKGQANSAGKFRVWSKLLGHTRLPTEPKLPAELPREVEHVVSRVAAADDVVAAGR